MTSRNSSSVKKPPYQDRYYVEIDEKEANDRQPGTFFYGPVLYEPNIVATVRPVTTPGGRYAMEPGDKQKILFKIEMPLAADAFLRQQGIGSVVGPYEELVAVPGKMRPVVILSPAVANQSRILALPSFKAENYDLDALAAIRSGESLEHFHLPACGPLNVMESVLDFTKIQPLVLNSKLVTPGNRKADDTRRRNLRLSGDYMEELRAALRDHLGL